MALEQAGAAARGATVVTTLEPCDRQGRTPPCTRALIAAGVGRVVVGAIDPHLGEGAPGLAELRSAGISVETGVLEAEARRLNEAFEHHVANGLPFVVMKSAASLDGKTAAVDGTSRWITSEDARSDVQRLRAWSDAILVGSRTVAEDDPALTVRDPRFAGARPPLRVVVDSGGRLPAVGRLFDGSAPTLIATTDRTDELRVAEWQTAGAEVVVVDRDADDGVSLPGAAGAARRRATSRGSSWRPARTSRGRSCATTSWTGSCSISRRRCSAARRLPASSTDEGSRRWARRCR